MQRPQNIPKGTVVYITNQCPSGKAEAFAAPEIWQNISAGLPVLVIPRSKEPFFETALNKKLAPYSLIVPLFSPRIFLAGAHFFLQNLKRCVQVLRDVWRADTNFVTRLKNLCLFPKGLFLAGHLDWSKVVHIHAYWSSTPATLALIVSNLTKVPWSFTAHRGDITLNNALSLKLRTATGCRCISLKSQAMILERTRGEFAEKLNVIYMGVRLPAAFQGRPIRQESEGIFRLATPAMFRPVKGHRYIVEAAKLLVARGRLNFKWLLFGYGEIQQSIESLIKENGLEEWIEIQNYIAHNTLLSFYEKGEIDCVVLPSILTEDGEHEGIPVSLMEAMACQIPVISTLSGGIPELLSSDAGVLIPPGSGEALAAAVEAFMLNVDLRMEYGRRGRVRVEQGFNIEQISYRTRGMFAGDASPL